MAHEKSSGRGLAPSAARAKNYRLALGRFESSGDLVHGGVGDFVVFNLRRSVDDHNQSRMAAIVRPKQTISIEPTLTVILSSSVSIFWSSRT